jgi:hypothetical protein
LGSLKRTGLFFGVEPFAVFFFAVKNCLPRQRKLSWVATIGYGSAKQHILLNSKKEEVFPFTRCGEREVLLNGYLLKALPGNRDSVFTR